MQFLNSEKKGSFTPKAEYSGKTGILGRLKPFKGDTVDAKLYEITVDDLLRHAGGWDSEVSPIKDPMFNKLQVANNNRITNISKEMKISGELNIYDVISFMMSQPLDFTPGEKSEQLTTFFQSGP